MPGRFPPPRGPLAGNMWNKPGSGARSRKSRRRLGPSNSDVFYEFARKRMKKIKKGR